MNDKKLITALLYMVIGVVLCIMGPGLINIAMTIVGICLIVMGIVDIAKKNYAPGIIKIVISIFIIYAGWLLIDLIIYVIAAILIIQGLLSIMRLASNAKRYNALMMVLSLLEILASLGIGIGLIFYRGKTLTWAFIVAGVLLIIEGILVLFDGGKKKLVKKRKRR